MKAGVLPQAYSVVKEKAEMGIRWGFGLREEVGLGGAGGYRGGERVYGAIAAACGNGTYIICIRRE